MGARIEVKKGERYGRLTVVSEAPRRITRSGRPERAFLCICDCGESTTVRLADLRHGHTTSCGCAHKQMVAKLGRSNATHGMTDSPEWKSWKAMKDRCYGDGRSDYHNYRGRGITVCKRWRDSFIAFLSDMGSRPDNTSLERIDNDGNYEPDNCCWATPEEQGRNRRTNRLLTLNGRTMCLKEWAEETGIAVTTLHQRLRKGWTVEKALATPVRSYECGGAVR